MANKKDFEKTVVFMRNQGMTDDEIRSSGPELAAAVDRMNQAPDETSSTRGRRRAKGSGASSVPPRPAFAR